MPLQRYKPEQIVTMLRQIEVGIANGKNTPQVCKEAAITVQTFYRWRKEYGGLKMDQAKRMKELDSEGHRGGKLLSPLWKRMQFDSIVWRSGSKSVESYFSERNHL